MHHSACAFTMKILHFCQMMHSLGHEVFHYGVEGSEVPCEDVTIITKAEQEGWFGQYNPDALYNVNWNYQAPYWDIMNRRAADEINKRKKIGDFVCVMAGALNRPLQERVGEGVMTVEYGIGYSGTFAKFRVFESYAHMHKIYGAQGSYDPDGLFYDAVIPNYLNPADYPFKADKQDYFLYLGRLIKRKGINIAVETCNRIGARLVVAGQGCVKYDCRDKTLLCEDGGFYQGVEYVGFATGQKRADLFGNAKGCFVPTTYLEPFGAVAIEAQMAGTPAITTDFGAFTETVEHGVTGFRCHTLDHFVWAAKNVDRLWPAVVHNRAVSRYSMDVVKYKYEEYFGMLTDLWKDGWYQVNENREQLDWLGPLNPAGEK
jgi:glycosyltransferase involved in cell wall biosynthesis